MYFGVIMFICFQQRINKAKRWEFSQTARWSVWYYM